MERRIFTVNTNDPAVKLARLLFSALTKKGQIAGCEEIFIGLKWQTTPLRIHFH